MNFFNDVRNPSDHHVIGTNIVLKDIKVGGTNTNRRKWKNFNQQRFIKIKIK